MAATDPRLALRGNNASTFSLRELERLIGQPQTIVEAGVADGTDTLKFLNRWPRATVVGVEPIDTLFQVAWSRTQIYRERCHLFQTALGLPGQTQIDIYTGKDHQSSSTLRPSLHLEVFPDIHLDEIQIVPSRTLDDLGSLTPNPPDLLWLDLQGFELEVLTNGGNRTLEASRLVHIEVSRVPMYEHAPSYLDVIAFFRDSGFELIELRMPANFGNALFLNRRNGL